MVHLINNFLTRYISHLMAAVVGIVAIAFIRTAVQAWQDAVKLDQEERSLTQRLLTPLAARLGPANEIQVRQLRMQLARAGMRDDDAVKRFTYSRALCLAVGLGLGGLLQLTHMQFMFIVVLSLLILYIAIKLPDIWLNEVIKMRQIRIARALPAVIDLMVLCLDVGLSIEAAFERVTSEMQSMEPLMAEESQVMVSEMGAGLTFPQALKRMADRIGLDDLTTMSRLISQANALGASVTQALREYSEASLSKRMLALEEHAGKISAWLVMPLTLFLLPASLLALAGPAIVILTSTLRH